MIENKNDISTLLVEMAANGAEPDELIRATNHSMAIIDAPKKGTDIMKSAEENRIADLERKYL